MATSDSRNEPSLDPALLEILRCPLTHSRLSQQGEWLVAETGGLAYPIREGFPVMLIEEARLPEGIRSLADFKERFKDEIASR